MQKRSALPATAELAERIGWLIRLRWVAILGVIITLESARRFFHLRLALPELYGVTAGLALYNFVLSLVAGGLHRRGAEARPRYAAALANVQISLDLAALAALLHFSGGVENPFTYYFIFHMIIASILLSRRATYLQASLAMGLMTAVGVGEYFGALPHYSLAGLWREGAYQNGTFVGAQLFVLGTTLYLSVFMAASITSRLRQRERETVLLSEDVERKAAMLEAAYERLSETERTKSQYMRKVSHELRGPLGTIQTALKAVLEGLAGEVPVRSRDLITRAERRAGELAQVTQDLLVLSRAREARPQVQMSDVKPAEIAAAVVEEMKGPAERAGVALLADMSSDLGMMRGDAMGLEQMIGNLVSNAIRYTPRGGKVSLRLKKTNAALRLEVEDTGMGIPQEDLGRIFDEFYRAANAREKVSDGSGLGLSIVKAVAEQHQGSVSVESTVGKGTRFTVDLPLAPAGGDEYA